jgi:hypothetical protein|tara:strand:- start:563 stop:742 length:180 start_codon:yes stop_codon:yes gene_type:complete
MTSIDKNKSIWKIDKNLALISFIIALSLFWYVKKLHLEEAEQFDAPGVYLKKQGGKHAN